MAECLEGAVAVWEVSGLSPGRGGQKNFCGCREPSDYVSFLRAVKRQRFRTLNHTIQSQEQHNSTSLQTLYTLEMDLGPFPIRWRSFPPE